jgi:tight adherence protein C
MTSVLVVLVGLGAGCGLCLLAAGLFPSRPSLRSIEGYLQGAETANTPVARRSERVSLDERVGRVSSRLVEPKRLLWHGGQVRSDLAVLDRSLETHLGSKVGSAVMGLVTVGAIGALLQLFGLSVGVQIPALLALGFATLLFFVPDLALVKQAKERRSELRSVLAMFLDCVELGLAGGYGPATALDVAASAVAGTAGMALRATLGEAARSGQTPWAALEELGRRWGLVDLVETAGTVALGDSGARIRQSLAARSQSLRAAVNAETQAQAQAASIHAVVPLGLLALGTLILVAYPYVARLTIPR